MFLKGTGLMGKGLWKHHQICRYFRKYVNCNDSFMLSKSTVHYVLVYNYLCMS